MSTKVSSRPRKQRVKDEMKQEIVVQVHKTVKKDVQSENLNRTESGDKSSESNRTFILEDKNDNYSLKTPSRDVSVDEETQINSKILNLIETEMKRDINKLNHFTDSRPQSLSFYEDEKVPEELSGNLELLSPEERKHYRRRKEYLDIDMERNAYNSMQDALNRENEDINGSSKKSKRDKRKKHSVDTELGLGDSREMMIPKEKRKSKKKKREYSPISSSSGKRKHKKKDEDFEPRNDITLALEELQDDVFENSVEEYNRIEKMRKSPKRSDKIYVQRKGKFEASYRDGAGGRSNEPEHERKFKDMNAIEVATGFQKNCIPIGTLCHGLLGGLALSHYIFLSINNWPNYDKHFFPFYATYSDIFTCVFYLLNVACLISVFDKFELAHLDMFHLRDLITERKSCIVMIVYLLSLLIHLLATVPDYKLGLMKDVLMASNWTEDETQTSSCTESNISMFYNGTYSINQIQNYELITWNWLSAWRAIFAILGWVIVAIFPGEDLLYVHLKNMEKYAIST